MSESKITIACVKVCMYVGMYVARDPQLKWCIPCQGVRVRVRGCESEGVSARV